MPNLIRSRVGSAGDRHLKPDILTHEYAQIIRHANETMLLVRTMYIVRNALLHEMLVDRMSTFLGAFRLLSGEVTSAVPGFLPHACHMHFMVNVCFPRLLTGTQRVGAFFQAFTLSFEAFS
jgi:hypothetical protein